MLCDPVNLAINTRLVSTKHNTNVVIQMLLSVFEDLFRCRARSDIIRSIILYDVSLFMYARTPLLLSTTRFQS